MRLDVRPLLCSMAMLTAALPAQAEAAAIVWHADLAAATKLAAEQHAPLFVVFRCER
jgi:hypothetical protein